MSPSAHRRLSSVHVLAELAILVQARPARRARLVISKLRHQMEVGGYFAILYQAERHRACAGARDCAPYIY